MEIDILNRFEPPFNQHINQLPSVNVMVNLFRALNAISVGTQIVFYLVWPLFKFPRKITILEKKNNLHNFF